MRQNNSEYLNDLIGKNIDDEAVLELDARAIGPDTLYTQDVVMDRLNFIYNEDDIIKSWYYG